MAVREEGRDDHFNKLNNIIKEHYMGKFNLNIDWVSSPQERFRARLPSPTGVENLVESYIKYGTVSEHCEVVLFWATEKLPSGSEFKTFMSSTLVTEAVRNKQGFLCNCGRPLTSRCTSGTQEIYEK